MHVGPRCSGGEQSEGARVSVCAPAARGWPCSHRGRPSGASAGQLCGRRGAPAAAQDINLRELTKKYGRGIGLNIGAVRAYAAQLLTALYHLRNCGVIHADIKARPAWRPPRAAGAPARPPARPCMHKGAEAARELGLHAVPGAALQRAKPGMSGSR